MPSPRPIPTFAPEFSPERLVKFEGEGVRDDEGEEVRVDDEGEKVGVDEEVGIDKEESVEEGDARIILKWPLLNLGPVSPGR